MTTDAPAAPFRDLRQYLAFLEHHNRLRRVRAPVDKDAELACVARWALEGTPAQHSYGIVFDNIVGHDTPVAVNLYYPRTAYADALGVRPGDVLSRWSSAMRAPRAPDPTAEQPPDWNVDTQTPDLTRLPVPTWTPRRDGAPYLSAACVITKDPETGVQNVGTYRVQIHGERRAGLFFGSQRQHGAMHYRKWCERGEPMPIAVVLGAPPAVSFAAAAKTAYGVDELTIAGGLMDRPVPIVKAATVPLAVPAHVEMVIEGVVHPAERLPEGPFGEALGYMEAGGAAPVIDVTALGYRSTPIHQGYVQQLPPSEGHLVMELSLLGPLWHYLTDQLGVEGIRDLAIVPGSAGVSALAVQIAQTHAADAARIGRTLAKIGFGQKFIYLVDEDVELTDPHTLQWALTSRTDPVRDVALVDDTAAFQIDPSVTARARRNGVELTAAPYQTSTAIIDATGKGGAPPTALPPADLMRSVLDRWDAFGLPPIDPPLRLQRLLSQRPDG